MVLVKRGPHALVRIILEIFWADQVYLVVGKLRYQEVFHLRRELFVLPVGERVVGAREEPYLFCLVHVIISVFLFIKLSVFADVSRSAQQLSQIQAVLCKARFCKSGRLLCACRLSRLCPRLPPPQPRGIFPLRRAAAGASSLCQALRLSCQAAPCAGGRS